MFTPQTLKFVFFCFLASLSPLLFAFESYDDQLYKISKENPSFSGFYINKLGDSVILITNRNKLKNNEVVRLKSKHEAKKIIGTQLVSSLEGFYGAHKVLGKDRIKDLAEIEEREPNKNIIIVKFVRYSFSDLYEWFSKLNKELGVLANISVNYIDIDEVKNQIVLGFTDEKYFLELKNYVESFGIPNEAIKIIRSKKILLQSNVKDKFTPVKAGTQIIWSDLLGYKACTAGFIAEINNQTGLFTNAHCTLLKGVAFDGTIIRQGRVTNNTIIGDSALESSYANSNCSTGGHCYNSDAAFIPIPQGVNVETTIVKTRRLNSSPIDLNLKTGRKSAWTRLHIWENERFSVGDSVYKTGRTSGTTSGTIVGVCVTLVVDFATINCSSKVVGDAAVFSLQGDSGSAVLGSIMGGKDFGKYTYRRSLNARILGLHFGSDGTYAYFSPINSIIQEFGAITNE